MKWICNEKRPGTSWTICLISLHFFHIYRAFPVSTAVRVCVSQRKKAGKDRQWQSHIYLLPLLLTLRCVTALYLERDGSTSKEGNIGGKTNKCTYKKKIKKRGSNHWSLETSLICYGVSRHSYGRMMRICGFGYRLDLLETAEVLWSS